MLERSANGRAFTERFNRDSASRQETIAFIESVVMKKEPRHFINDPEFVTSSRSMSFVGG